MTLLCGKSSRVTNMTIPRAELKACRMAAVLSGRLLRVLGDQVKTRYFVTDSTISLSWISSDERPLETAVRNAVIEIRRFSTPYDWFHVDA